MINQAYRKVIAALAVLFLSGCDEGRMLNVGSFQQLKDSPIQFEFGDNASSGEWLFHFIGFYDLESQPVLGSAEITIAFNNAGHSNICLEKSHTNDANAGIGTKNILFKKCLTAGETLTWTGSFADFFVHSGPMSLVIKGENAKMRILVSSAKEIQLQYRVRIVAERIVQ